jgi:hypothetical protein
MAQGFVGDDTAAGASNRFEDHEAWHFLLSQIVS